jgi:hypothetical protein
VISVKEVQCVKDPLGRIQLAPSIAVAFPSPPSQHQSAMVPAARQAKLCPLDWLQGRCERCERYISARWTLPPIGGARARACVDTIFLKQSRMRKELDPPAQKREANELETMEEDKEVHADGWQ